MDHTRTHRPRPNDYLAPAGRASACVAGPVPRGPGGQLVVPPPQPRIWMFQPLITLMGDGTATVDAIATQPFSRWMDGLHISMLQMKTDILRISAENKCALRIETSMNPEDDDCLWMEIAVYTARPGTTGSEIISLSSDSTEYGKSFARYVRWRVYATTTGDPWEICFRIKAIAGASFSEFPEMPRVV